MPLRITGTCHSAQPCNLVFPFFLLGALVRLSNSGRRFVQCLVQSRCGCWSRGDGLCWKFVLFCAQCSRNGHSGPEEDVQLLSWLISYYSSHVSLIPGIPLPLQSCSYKANSHPLFPLLLVCQWILPEEPRISLAEAWNLIPSLVRCCTCVFLAGNIGDYFTGNVVQSGENVSTHPCFPSGFNGGIS